MRILKLTGKKPLEKESHTVSLGAIRDHLCSCLDFYPACTVLHWACCIRWKANSYAGRDKRISGTLL